MSATATKARGYVKRPARRQRIANKKRKAMPQLTATPALRMPVSPLTNGTAKTVGAKKQPPFGGCSFVRRACLIQAQSPFICI